MDFRDKWMVASEKLWGFKEKPPTTAAIITNSGNEKFRYGTPVLANTAEGGQVLLTANDASFLVDHDARTVTLVYLHNGKTERLELPPLTEEQKAYFGVDFGGQFSS